MDYNNLIAAALKELKGAAGKLLEKTKPETPLPHPKAFCIIEGLYYPYYNHTDNRINYCRIGEGWPATDYYYLGNSLVIIEKCNHQPRLILRALRRIQAATAWCEARAEGRRRAAEEILRQQARAVEVLEAEAAMLALK